MRLRRAGGVSLAAALAWGCAIEAEPKVTPEVGSHGGGDAIRIEGAGFVSHGPPVVYVGDRAAKGVVIESDRLITALTPQAEDARDPGSTDAPVIYPLTVDVTVLFEDGTKVEIPEAFTYEKRTGVILQPAIGGG